MKAPLSGGVFCFRSLPLALLYDRQMDQADILIF